MDILREYRDDGPLATAIGMALPVRSLNAYFLLALGAVPVGAALWVERDAGPWTGAALGWFVLLAGGASARALKRRIDWLMPVVVRATEYGATVAMVALVDDRVLPAAYAYLFAASIHQYETVYRIRHLKVAPPRWLGWVAGGWEMRTLAVWLLAQTEYMSEGLFIVAAVTGTMFVLESAAVWIRRPEVA